MGSSNRIIIVLSAIVGVLFFIFVGLGVSYYVTNCVLKSSIDQQAELPSSQENKEATSSTSQKSRDNKESKEEFSEQKRKSSPISIKIYTPTEFDVNANANYYILLKNDGKKHFEGSFKIKNIQTQRETDKLGYIKLDPHEAKIIPCMGVAPNKNDVDVSLEGDVSDVEYQIDSSLEYTILSKEINNPKSKTGSTKLFIYVAPNESDENYLAICKEIKKNYDTGLIIADFSPVMIKPTKNDTRITFAQNKVMKFSHVLFYTTDSTNINIQEMERRIVDI